MGSLVIGVVGAVIFAGATLAAGYGFLAALVAYMLSGSLICAAILAGAVAVEAASGRVARRRGRTRGLARA